jgi:hypothetical protein
VEDEMTLKRMVCVLIAAVMMASLAARAQSGEPGTCPNDSKLLNDGSTRVFGEGPGTWWGLIMDGLIAAGFVEEKEQIAYLQQVFGRYDLDTLEDLKAYNLQVVEDGWDKNQNGYVCAFELRGRRAYFDNPYVDLTFFGVGDDKIGK